MGTIPKVLHEHIDTAFPANVCLVGTVLQANDRMLRLVRRLGLHAHSSMEDPGVVSIWLDL